jgi:ACDE family multidrug resistance protein
MVAVRYGPWGRVVNLAGHRREAAVEARSRWLAVAYLTTGAGVSGVSLVAPVLPELAATYGVDPDEMAWFQTAVMAPGVLSAVLLTRLAERLGLRPVLAGALAVYGLTGLSLLAVTDYQLAVALRLVQGFGGGALVAASFVILRRLSDVSRARAIGRNAALVSFMMVLLPLVGSALGSVSPRLPFSVYVLAAVLAPLAWRWSPERAERQLARHRLSGRARATLSAVLTCTVLVNVVFFGWLLFLAPVLLSERYGLAVEHRGLVLALQSLGATVVALATTRIRARGRYRRLTSAGWTTLALLFVGLSVTTDRMVALVAFAAAGLYYGAVNPAMISIVSELGRDSLIGWWQSAARFGQVVGPLLAALLLGSVSHAQVLLVGALLATAGLGLVPLLVVPHNAGPEPSPGTTPTPG